MAMRKALFRLGEKGALVFLRPFEAGGSKLSLFISVGIVSSLFSLCF